MKLFKSFAVSALAAASTLSFVALTAPSTSRAAEIGDASVLAQVPLPGFPEGIVANGLFTYVTGPATFGTAGNGTPSKLWTYFTPTGALLQTTDVQGEDLSQ